MSAQPMPDADPPVYTITDAELRMRRVAGWIENHMRPTDPEHPSRHGHAPTVREIGAYAGLRSSATVQWLLDQMREHGFLRCVPGTTRARATEVLAGPPLGYVASASRDRVLSVLRDCDGEMTARQIAARTSLTLAATGGVLSHMLRDKMIRRVASGAFRAA
jgi:SOS-response transcriptional repressor LexA